MNRSSHFFNIESADQLFNLLKTVANGLTISSEKRTEDFLLLIFGLTHLREWIAPDYNWKEDPVTTEQCFFHDIYKLDEFKLLKALCNRSKHMCDTNHAVGALNKSNKNVGSDVDSLSIPDRKLLVGYYVDGKDVEDVIKAVVKFYEDRWFRKSGNGQNAT